MFSNTPTRICEGHFPVINFRDIQIDKMTPVNPSDNLEAYAESLSSLAKNLWLFSESPLRRTYDSSIELKKPTSSILDIAFELNEACFARAPLRICWYQKMGSAHDAKADTVYSRYFPKAKHAAKLLFFVMADKLIKSWRRGSLLPRYLLMNTVLDTV